jgi:hydrogenase maturation factor
MCLTVPRRVEKINGKKALLQDGRWVSLAMVDGVSKGDMVMVNANLAIEKVDKRQVKHMKQLMEQEI